MGTSKAMRPANRATHSIGYVGPDLRQGKAPSERGYENVSPARMPLTIDKHSLPRPLTTAPPARMMRDR